MLVCDKLIYLQMQKTACSHIAAILEKTAGGRRMGLHTPLPRRLWSTDKYVVGSIRNPWDWYVSQWSYGCAGRGALFERLTGRRFFRFFEKPVAELKKPVILWRQTYRDYRDPEGFRQWLKLVFDPERSKDLGEGYAQSPLAGYAGLMTYRYTKIFCKNLTRAERRGLPDLEALKNFDSENNALNFTIRVESIEDDLVEALKRAGYTLDPKKLQAIRSGAASRTNPSRHLPSGQYYDEDTARLVGEKERLIIEKYDYSPPSR
jgi:hypothetical protein